MSTLLREFHSQPLQQTLKDLATAYRRAFDPKLSARFPRFKKRGRPQGIRFPQGFSIDGCGLYLPKIGWIGFRKSREIEGTPKNVTVSCDGEHWYVSIQTEREVEERVHASDSAVGIDLGVARFAALSDGTFVLPTPDGAEGKVLGELAQGTSESFAPPTQDCESSQRYAPQS